MKNYVFFWMALGLILPLSAGAETHEYRCFGSYGNDHERVTLDLLVGWDQGSGIIKSGRLSGIFGGYLDVYYEPRDYVRYGSNLVIEKKLLNGGKKLSDGSTGGFATISRIENGWGVQYTLLCRI